MTQERIVTRWSGWAMLVVEVLVLPGLAAWAFLVSLSAQGVESGWGLAAAIATSVVWFFLLFGFFTLQPNMSAVLLLFGKYSGTCIQEGFRWANPLLIKKKISLRANNLNGQKLKVNDRMGSPVEIAAVVVWRVKNTAQAVFDVEDYHQYVEVQSESALRHLASKYPYDTLEHEEELSLRGSIDEVSKDLQDELSERLGKAGVVEMALEKLEEHNTIKLDEERKDTMVSNLLVVLCGEQSVSPVVNTGTLYN